VAHERIERLRMARADVAIKQIRNYFAEWLVTSEAVAQVINF